MSDQNTDMERRRFLTTATSVVGGVGVAFAAVPFIVSWRPSARAEAIGAPVEVEIDKLEVGQMMTVQWRGKPVWIVRRSDKDLEQLQEIDDRLRDPASEQPQQPSYCENYHRSIKPSYGIMVGLCTHLGCSPTYRPDEAPADLGPSWVGGFFCPCHGSSFDLAGRVYAGVPAPLNLEVPPHSYLSDTKVIVGVDQGAA